MENHFAPSYVAGSWKKAGTRQVISNPANLDEKVGVTWYAEAHIAELAMDAAAAAWPQWRKTSFPQRCRIVERALNLVDSYKNALAPLLTRENGKTLKESLAEINGALRDGRYLLSVAREQSGNEAGSPEEIRYDPRGVFVLITPWNFPLATMVRKMVPALILGNTVVAKPSEVTPLTTTVWFQCLAESGLPAGVANMVQGQGALLAPPLFGHSALRGVSFTGSTHTGRLIESELLGRRVQLQMEMGGKNALVALKDANLDAAADAAVYAAFSCAGQWCTSTSRVIVEAAVHDVLLRKIVARAGKIKMGDGMHEKTTMGPVVSQAQHDKVSRAIEQAVDDNARLIAGGDLPTHVDGARGYWVEPTVFSEVSPESELAKKEIFGPVLSVLRAADADVALRIANATEYGLSFAIYTEDLGLAERFVDRVDAGMCHINRPTSYREPSMPLTGWKASGYGAPECGPFAREFFTRPRAIYRKTS